LSAPEEATEAVTEVVEEVAGGNGLGMFFGGLVVGVAGGGVLGYIFAQRRLETKYQDLAQEEIEEMREHYHQKSVALEAEAGKKDLGEIVKERGYVPEEPEESAEPPMAVTPPTAVVERAEETADEEAEPEPSEEEVDEAPEPVTRNVFRDREDLPEWDEHKERARRSPMKPYVIHREERDTQEAYDGVTYTYYEQDDVVCDERDDVIPEEDRERIFGEANLERFGHGSGDPTVVYIRNDKLEMDIEIVRSPNSYAEEVHGFVPEIKHSDRRRRGRTMDDDD
jgi:hypothetical protein